MNMIIVNYVQLICVTLFMTNNVDCEQLMTQNEEIQTIKVSTCTAKCQLDTAESLKKCYDQCYEKSHQLPTPIIEENDTENFSFHLFCRDPYRLAIEIAVGEGDEYRTRKDEKFIFLIVLTEANSSSNERSIYINDLNLFEIKDRKPHTSYKITAMVISSKSILYKLGSQNFTTLDPNFQPEMIADIQISDQQKFDERKASVMFRWEPARDDTCDYEFITHHENQNPDDEVEIIPTFVSFPDLFHFEETFPFGSKVNVAVRGRNVNNRLINSSAIKWVEFKVESCMYFVQDRSICGPEKIFNVTQHLEYLGFDKFRVNFSWNEPSYNPDYYELSIGDINPARDSNGDPIYSNFIVDGNATSIFVDKIELKGFSGYFRLTSYIGNRSLSEDYHIEVESLRNDISLWNFVIIVVILSSLVIILLICLIAKLIEIRKKRRSRENMDLDLIKSITNRSILEAVDELTRDENMEIDRDNIKILEALGEGAFGYVKRGIIIKDDTKLEVAVKMLKNNSNLDDIKQFHQEISVMKSVGKHENIVSIIGHCTSNFEDLMLLTEFCESGNLLELLRKNFNKQLKFYSNKISCMGDEYDDKENLHHREEDEGNFSCSPKLFVVNKMYDDLNNNSNSGNNNESLQKTALKVIEMAATNPLYFNFNESDPQPVIIDIPTTDTFNEILTSYDLISFAKQVSDGMNFLANKKVVHRDLAARNVLVCSSGRHVKIADFGLSRDIYQENMYRKTGSGKLPIKWLAIESMTHQVYTSQSDVWSFGILLFEIITLGATPYPSISTEQLLKVLSTGYRMEKPNHCHNSFYDIMQSCWLSTPQARPNFEELSKHLQDFLIKEKSENVNYIDLAKLFDKCLDETIYMKPIA